MTIDFKGSQHPKCVILRAALFYVRYAVSYRHIEEIVAERGVEVDHTTLHHWAVRLSPMIVAKAQSRKRPTAVTRRMVETYIKVSGKWIYFYRVVGTSGVPDRIAIDKSGASFARLQKLNAILKFTNAGRIITIFQSKYLNNIVEQDNRFNMRITRLQGLPFCVSNTRWDRNSAHDQQETVGLNRCLTIQAFAALAA